MDSLDDFRLTRHALSRLCDMAVSPDEITEALLRPECVYRSKSYPDFDLFQSGRLTLSVARHREPGGKRTVATALWRYADDWEDDYRFEPAEGREPRSTSHLRRRPV